MFVILLLTENRLEYLSKRNHILVRKSLEKHIIKVNDFGRIIDFVIIYSIRYYTKTIIITLDGVLLVSLTY